MNFFGYYLGKAFPPPDIEYPDFYTDNLKPLVQYNLDNYIKIHLSTSGHPNFLISVINADMKTLEKIHIQELYNVLINNLDSRNFDISLAINNGVCIQQNFNKGQYTGKIFFEHEPNQDGEYWLSFVINDTTLPSKGLF